jgi:hypothetical protein
MPDYKVRYLVLKRKTEYEQPSEKQTIVEKINAETVEKARKRAEDLAEMRSSRTEKWIVKAIEEVN